jgi:methyl-accepting chemotaxis protein
MNKLLQWLGFSERKKITTQSSDDPISATGMRTGDGFASARDGKQYVDVAAATKVMTMLEKQLGEVSSDVESSVVGVCQGFQGMTERAQSAINLAQGAVGMNEHGKEGDLIQQMQRVMESLLENVRLSSEFSQEVSQKLLNLESRLNLVENTIEEVEEISNRAKLVALNGQIEASRLGTQGRAFQVVAEETKALATNAAKTSDTIRSSINQLAIELHGTSSSIRTRAASDSESFRRSEESAKKLLSDIQSANSRIKQSLTQTVKIGGELRTDIAKAVMSMQFQDRVSQRIAHVIETLDILTTRMKPVCANAPQKEVELRCSEWMREITARYTMDSERELHGSKKHVTTKHSTHSKAEECSVELF